MSRILIECFGKEAELISFKQDGESAIAMEFGREYDGYVVLGSTTARIKGALCALDTRRLEDGEYTPHLVLTDMTVDLPKIRKQYGIITPVEPDTQYLVALSLRERELRERVEKLEGRVLELTQKIEGARLFGEQP